MKKTDKVNGEMRGSRGLVRGKYAVRYAKATNVVVIDESLTKAFPNTDAVNEALRSLLTVATRIGRSSTAKNKTS